MKSQLIEKLRELLNSEDIMSIRDAVHEVRSDWKAETAKERQEQLEAYKAVEHAEDDEFIFVPNALEQDYQDLNERYEKLIDEVGKRLAAVRKKNYEDKLSLLKEFETLVRDEENISKAFEAHREIKEKWDAIGDVPGNKYQEIHDQWQKLNHEFYYNINIYRTLKEHDLKINQKKKEELIEATKMMTDIESVNELEILAKKYQREWMNIGPSPQENYKELGDEFFGLMRVAQDKIQAHYDALHAHSEENLAKKKELVVKLKEILEMEITNMPTWNRYTEEVRQAQEEWKSIGWAKKKDNEEAWNEFRGLCDLFFTRRNTFIAERKAGFQENFKKKEELIEKARVLQNSEDWKEATVALKKLQSEWKATGPAGMKEEQKLWLRFRSICDHFFTRKKEKFEGREKELQENLAVKEDMLKQLEALEMTGNKVNDLTVLREFSDRWNAVGFVPRENLKSVMERYNAILDKKYDKINADREERELSSFRNRLASLKNSADGESRLKREKAFIREKIERFKREINQYENNMSIFTGKGAEALRKDIEKKIKNAKREIDDLRKKMNMLDSNRA